MTEVEQYSLETLPAPDLLPFPGATNAAVEHQEIN
jgi:hypothetical protein